MRVTLLYLLTCLSLLGCQKKAHDHARTPRIANASVRGGQKKAAVGTGSSISMVYTVTVPKDVPKKMTFHPKMAKTYEADAHAMYRESHRSGWEQCVRTYLRGRLTPDTKAVYMTQFGLQQRADQAGFKQCRVEILALIAHHGAARVKAALTKQHGALVR